MSFLKMMEEGEDYFQAKARWQDILIEKEPFLLRAVSDFILF